MAISAALRLPACISHITTDVVVDEPTAGSELNETDRPSTAFIRQVRDDLGMTVLLIEHDMKVVMGISERVMR